jgi:hypothetical protein
VKLVELSDQQLVEVVGGDGWYFGISCGWNVPGGPGCQIGFGYSKKLSFKVRAGRHRSITTIINNGNGA